MHARIAASLAAGLLLVAVTSAPGAPEPESPAARWWAQGRRAGPSDRPGDQTTMLRKLLRTRITVRFQATPAREAISHIRGALGISIIGRYSDDRAGSGIDAEAPITLDAFDRPALEVLEMVLEQCSDLEACTWQLRRGYVEVGTKTRLSRREAQEVRLYPIRDLMLVPPWLDNAPQLNVSAAFNQGGGSYGGGGGRGGRGGGGGVIDPPGEERPRPDEGDLAQRVIDLIRAGVEPEAWASNGGSFASIRHHGGMLIVRAPDYIHRQIAGYAPSRPHGVGPASLGILPSR